jgi:hypothetical protein
MPVSHINSELNRYELIVGRVPWKSQDAREILEYKQTLSFPLEPCLSHNAMDFIRRYVVPESFPFPPLHHRPQPEDISHPLAFIRSKLHPHRTLTLGHNSVSSASRKPA